MSTFLTRLINRHLDIGDYVRPRPRARFEPEAANATPVADRQAETNAEKIDPDSQQENTTHMASMSKPTINDAVRNTTESGGRDKSDRGPIHGSIQPRLRHQETENRDLEAGQLNDYRPKSADLSSPERSMDRDRLETQRDKRSISLSPLRSVIQGKEGVTDNPAPAKGRDLQKNTDRGVRSAARKSTPPGEPRHRSKSAKSDLAPMVDSTTRQDGTDDQHRDQLPPEPIPLRNVMAESEGLLEPLLPIRIDGQSEASARMSSRGSAAETEPVINVTIGRIEIRAVPDREHKEAKRQAKPSGIMSLNQYLQRRARGGNR